MKKLILTALFLICALVGLSKSATAQESVDVAQAQEGNVDDFMAKVLRERKVNWDKLYNYIFNESEVFEFRGSLEIPALQSFRREYVWYVKDGYLVRSPVSVNGVRVSDEYREKKEKSWVESGYKQDGPAGSIDRNSFFKFKFEPGNYYFAGRRKFNGRNAVIVEYYPRKYFAEENDDDEGEKYAAMLDKTSLVTMIIDPTEYQILHMTYDNVGMDFLPGRYLIRVDQAFAAMTMDKPLGDVWLPTELIVAVKFTTATGDISGVYKRKFYDYKRTEVKVKYRFWDQRKGEK